MRIVIRLAVITVMIFSCKDDKKPFEITKEDTISFKKVHSLIDANDKTIGDVVIGNMVNDTLFKELYIIKNTDTIYQIKNRLFRNKEGIDFEIYTDNFSGFYLVHNASDYIVLGGTFNRGKDISDNLTIEWNPRKELMYLLRLP
ncbi:hypothetical protein KIM67_14625 [Flagellimonas sp. 389]|uniref:hypothetical protein n=1 Tax=Flagellimonas sp. 389 TaxID=2835862 RepID=UPI001BD1DB7A|nr:hypothetical protein [Flagellimonas sp. 389]MBS9463651.1 hypothetical protein [Flagellimonas sp. 389]